MGKTSVEAAKHPYLRAKFWVEPNNHFWLNNGLSYTAQTIKHFENLVGAAEWELMKGKADEIIWKVNR